MPELAGGEPRHDLGEGALTLVRDDERLAGAPPATITLFGGLRIAIDGSDRAARLPGRQGRTLVAYLVLNADRAVGRDELREVLWPRRQPADPEAALSSVLAKVRRALEPIEISGRGALTLTLPPRSTVDVHDAGTRTALAERALADGDPGTAHRVAHEVADALLQRLLPDLDGAWTDALRPQFDDLARRALEVQAKAGLALGGHHLPAAERAAAALIAREPFREGGYALLMQAQARQGNVAEALRTFDRVRTFLRDELGTSPSAALVGLSDSLLLTQAGTRAPAAGEPVPAAPPIVAARLLDGTFFGREEHLERLRGRWRESRCATARLVVVVGEAGIGKTRLAAEFADEVHADGHIVLYGRADEEALLPHQPFVEALRDLIARGGSATARVVEQEREILCRLLPDLALPGQIGQPVDRGSDDTLRYRLFEAVGALLRAASRRAPVLLILDDLHWADRPTLLLLRHLLRQPQLTDLLVVGTFRHVEVGRDHPLLDLLAELRRERRYDRVTLAGLDEPATLALVVDRLGRAVTPEFVRRLREQTEGNAFFIEETLRALVESRLDASGPLSASVLERLGVPEGVAEIVGRRVRHLSDHAADVLRAASVVGRDFDLAVVAQLVGHTPERAIAALEECMAAGLVVERADRIDAFAFAHALVREALYEALTVSRRVRLHHSVAEALQAAADDAVNPAELAHHFLLARHFAGPEPARRHSIAAAERATELLAYEEAVKHYRQAVALFEDERDEPERCEVLLALGRAQWRAGGDAARMTFRAVANSAARRGDDDLLARAALGYSARYHEAGIVGPRGLDLLEDALRAAGDGDSLRRALLLGRLAGNLAFSSEQRQRASLLSAEALAIARRLRDENLLLASLMARHSTLLDVHDLNERLALSEEFMRLRAGHRELMAERHHWRLYDLLEAADVDGARGWQPRFEALAQRMRQPQWLCIAVGWRGIWAELAGDVAAAERCAEECLHHAQRAGMRDAHSTWAAKLLVLRRRQGRLDELAPVVERLVRGADLRRTGWRAGHGLILAETGDVAAARTIYREELAAYPRALPQFWLTSAAVLSELCAVLGDADGARELYAALSGVAHRNVVVAYASCWGPVERHLALLAATFGDDALRGRHARAALARTRAMNAPLLTADLRERHGDWLDS